MGSQAAPATTYVSNIDRINRRTSQMWRRRAGKQTPRLGRRRYLTRDRGGEAAKRPVRRPKARRVRRQRKLDDDVT